MRLAATVLLALLIPAAGAQAATVKLDRSVEHDEGETAVIGELTVTASPGETNTQTAQYIPGKHDALVVSDSTTPLTAGTRCTQVDENTVRCQDRHVPSIDGVKVKLGDGDDTFAAPGRMPFDFFVNGGPGDDQLSGREGVISGDAGNDTLTGTPAEDDFQGGPGDDVLSGDRGDDYLDAGPGDDTVDGGPGHDNLYGGGAVDDAAPAGTDTLIGGTGNDSFDDQDDLGGAGQLNRDTLIGGPGRDDVQSYLTRKSPVHVDLSQPDGNGGAGENDHIEGIEDVYGGFGDDVLIGDDGPNMLDGDKGRDELDGGGGDDLIESVVDPREDNERKAAPKYGPDTVSGGAGDDAIETLGMMQSKVACDEDEDTVYLVGFSSDKPNPRRGPLVSASCEHLTMTDGPRRKDLVVDPVPDDVSAASIFLDFTLLRRPHRVDVARKGRKLAAATARKKRVQLLIGSLVIDESQDHAVTLRGHIADVATNPFVWRFQIGRDAF